MLARFARLTLGASPAARPSAATTRRLLCTGGYKKWDDVAGKNVHGAVENKVTSDLGGDEADAAAGASADARKPARARTGPGASSAPFWGQTTSSSSRGSFGSTFVSPQDKADLLQFQVYVRQRLSELNARMPPRLATRERAELAFLEEQVVQDHMPVRKKRIRDPLRDVHEREIRHTNLPLLSRFVSEAGAILPKRLTGVSPRKQRKLTKAIKRAHVLALMPKTWKLPRYRHASYADQFSMPEKTKFERSEDDEFRDPPDIRFPNQWENTRNPLEIDLARLVRASPGLPPQGRQGRK